MRTAEERGELRREQLACTLAGVGPGHGRVAHRVGDLGSDAEREGDAAEGRLGLEWRLGPRLRMLTRHKRE